MGLEGNRTLAKSFVVTGFQEAVSRPRSDTTKIQKGDYNEKREGEQELADRTFGGPEGAIITETAIVHDDNASGIRM